MTYTRFEQHFPLATSDAINLNLATKNESTRSGRVPDLKNLPKVGDSLALYTYHARQSGESRRVAFRDLPLCCPLFLSAFTFSMHVYTQLPNDSSRISFSKPLFFVTGMSYSTRHENMIRIEIMLLAQYQIMYFGHRGEPVVGQLLHPEIGHYICTGNVSISG